MPRISGNQRRGWWLDDARLIARRNPYSFWLPSASVLDRLKPGNQVKLIFCFDSDDPEAPRAERMWVTIEDVSGGLYRGSLDNEPKYMKQARIGEHVVFERRHIIDTDIKDASAKEFERYFQRCFVSNRILKDGERPRFAYREPPDREDDSGWRFLSGDESDAYINDPKNLSCIAVGKLLNDHSSLVEIFDEPDGQWLWSDSMTSWQKIED